MYNASHVALDRDSTPTIDVPVCSTSAPREWIAELRDYKKKKKCHGRRNNAMAYAWPQ